MMNILKMAVMGVVFLVVPGVVAGATPSCTGDCATEALPYAMLSSRLGGSETQPIDPDWKGKGWEAKEVYDWGDGSIAFGCILSGFRAQHFVNTHTKEHVLVFEGTRFDKLYLSFIDMAASVQQLAMLNVSSCQYFQARNTALEFYNDYNQDGKVTLAGHSLGGAMALEAGRYIKERKDANVPVYAFDPGFVTHRPGSYSANSRIYRLKNSDNGKAEILDPDSRALLIQSLRVIVTNNIFVLFDNPYPEYSGIDKYYVLTSGPDVPTGPLGLHGIKDLYDALNKKAASIGELPLAAYFPPSATQDIYTTHINGGCITQTVSGLSPGRQGVFHVKGVETNYKSSHPIAIDSKGNWSEKYCFPASRQPGPYKWWVTDNTTGAKSNVESYKLTSVPVTDDHRISVFGYPGAVTVPDTPPTSKCLDLTTDYLKLTGIDGVERYTFHPGERILGKVRFRNRGSCDVPEKADDGAEKENVRSMMFLSKGYKEDGHDDVTGWKQVGYETTKRSNLQAGESSPETFGDNKDKQQWQPVAPATFGTYNMVACIDRIHVENNHKGDWLEKHEKDNCTTEAVFTVVPYQPWVSTWGATSITQTSAVLQGRIDAQGAPTIGYFDFGNSPSSLNNIIEIGDIGSGNDPVTKTMLVNGLACGQRYYYRIRAVNQGGKSEGQLQIFDTARCPGVTNDIEAIYRIWNRDINTHYYDNLDGVQWVRRNFSGWNPPGLEFWTPKPGVAGSVPVYVAWHADSVPKRSMHLFTINKAQYDSITAGDYWEKSGTYFSAYATKRPGTTEVYAYYDSSPNESARLYTRSAPIPNASCSSGKSFGPFPKLCYEGVAWYAYPSLPNRPWAFTDPATAIGKDHASLHGRVTPQGTTTRVFFDYGVSNTYGHTVTHGDVGAGGNPVVVSGAISGLACGVTYHYRIRAENDGGYTLGNDTTFTTSPCARPDLAPGATSVSQTSLGVAGSFTLSTEIRNVGSAPSDATTLRFYVSGDRTISSDDTMIAAASVSGIGQNDERTVSVSATAPSLPGVYWVGACVDLANGETNSSNNCSPGTQVMVLERHQVRVNVIGNGRVSSTPAGIDCSSGRTCAPATFLDGDVVVLGQQTSAAWMFSGWSGALCSIDSGTRSCAITVNDDTVVTATFVRVGPEPDQYEPDNVPANASVIYSRRAQVHSISPDSDVDWVKFELVRDADVFLETSGTDGDTTLTLYDASLKVVAFNDDKSGSLFSRIHRFVPAGAYFVKVAPYGLDTASSNGIGSYTLMLRTNGQKNEINMVPIIQLLLE